MVAVGKVRIVRVIQALLIMWLLDGCAATRAPTPVDPDYPKGWLPLAGLGEECRKLDGTYENNGTLVNASEVSAPLRLTDLLYATDSEGRPSHDARDAIDATSIGLAVTSKIVDESHNTIGSIRATVEVAGRRLERTYRSYCSKEILLFVPWTPAAVSVLGPGGGQRNVWLGFDEEGSLIAKIGDYSWGMAIVVPYGSGSVSWARFKKH